MATGVGKRELAGNRDFERGGRPAAPDHGLALPAGLDEFPPAAAGGLPLADMLEHLARYTRQYFLLQERLLNEYCRDPAYARSRLAQLGELRSRLARVCIDHAGRDAEAHMRLEALCRDLRDETEAHGDELTRLASEALRLKRCRKAADNAAEFALVPRVA